MPIIAVSASLIEKERQHYIDAGFDGWILKPISFSRLSEILKGLVDQSARQNNLYRPGGWEHGGWFEDSQKDIWAADTAPTGEVPAQESKGAKIAAAVDDPGTKEEDTSEQSREQERLLEEQEAKAAPKATSLPVFGSKAMHGSDDNAPAEPEREQVASPAPIEE